MSTFFLILTVVAMTAVLAVLIIGIFGMSKGKEFDRKYGNRLMQARVWLQAIALALFAFALVTLKK